MKRLGLFMAGAALTFSLAACGQDEEVPTEAEAPQPIEVELTVPEQARVNEPVKLTALVTQGEEKVEDASEVEYEIWEEGKKDDSILIESSNDKKGIYSAETTFDHDGLYHIQVHVTAREMHVMPEKQIHIGEAEASSEDDHHDHGTTDGLSMHFMEPEDIKAEEETALMTHVELDGKPLEDTKVRYEIKDPSLDTSWAETEEVKPGEYTGSYQFPETGTYTVTIHVENDSIHEHEEHTIEVK